MPTTELQVLGEPGQTAQRRGLQSWQDIRAGWNTLYYGEANGATVICSAPVAAQFYRNGTDLALALQNSMNACTGRGATPNQYYVTYAPGTGVFTFGRCAGVNNPVAGCVAGGNRQFQIRWADDPQHHPRCARSPARPAPPRQTPPSATPPSPRGTAT